MFNPKDRVRIIKGTKGVEKLWGKVGTVTKTDPFGAVYVRIDGFPYDLNLDESIIEYDTIEQLKVLVEDNDV